SVAKHKEELPLFAYFRDYLSEKTVRKYEEKKFGLKYLIVLGGVLLILTANQSVYAQGRSQVVQLSGLVLGEDSTYALPGVNVYVPTAGRGTTTNQYGYFSMPVLPGDSVLFSTVGFKRQYFLVPENRVESMTIIVELLADTTYLPAITVFPYSSEEIFKEALLALNLPDENQYANMRDNLADDLLAQMFQAMPMDGSMNHRYFMDQQFNYIQNRSGPQPNPFLNPFAWGEFIKSIKRGDFKRKKK
ncbi:MAG: carboxypeptidase-like regulatory domain-containing protein, partial [Tunicatimonas sp.]|uniref:carboxypeptidase-like regulatory domain-containing protein n=1 Tax=Tunicatimonas sp. TaxID=1940096 RepID=UPI003C759CAA